jgi:nucleotide-binding universal stress UspA family protein
MAEAPIVVGYDGSPGARAALGWAIDDARRRLVALRLVFAVEPSLRSAALPFVPGANESGGEQARWARERLDAIIATSRASAPDIEITGYTPHDIAASVLHDLSGTSTMVVVGSRGPNGLAGVLLGSVTTALALHAQGPVVVVRPDAPHPVDGPVVVGFDGSASADRALVFAAEEAALRSVGLVAVSAGVTGSDTPPGLTDRFPGVEVTVARVPGHLGRALVDAAGGAQLVVTGRSMGSHGGAHGSVGRYLLRHAAVPVCIVSP